MSSEHLNVISTPGARLVMTFNSVEAEIAVTGEIDAANQAALRAALDKCRDRGFRRIVLDASELDFLAVAAARDVAGAADVTVVNAYGIVKRVLDLVAAPGT